MKLKAFERFAVAFAGVGMLRGALAKQNESHLGGLQSPSRTRAQSLPHPARLPSALRSLPWT